jgi:hypothetical protein
VTPELKALYTLKELALAAGLSKHRMQKLLTAQNVFVFRAEGCVYVPATEVRDRLGPMWDAIVLVDATRAAKK